MEQEIFLTVGIGGEFLLQQDAEFDSPFDKTRVVFFEPYHLCFRPRRCGDILCRLLGGGGGGPISGTGVCAITSRNPDDVELFAFGHGRVASLLL